MERKIVEQRADKIKFVVRLCTYRRRRHNTRKEFGDFWWLKGGLTTHAMLLVQFSAHRFPSHRFSAPHRAGPQR